ncbi:hypothetical protein DINM_003941 [Dirofilaria immitis]|nr:hypothetical protein [Dirofilaria immitis]
MDQWNLVQLIRNMRNIFLKLQLNFTRNNNSRRKNVRFRKKYVKHRYRKFQNGDSFHPANHYPTQLCDQISVYLRIRKYAVYETIRMRLQIKIRAGRPNFTGGQINDAKFDEVGECSNNQYDGAWKRIKQTDIVTYLEKNEDDDQIWIRNLVRKFIATFYNSDLLPLRLICEPLNKIVIEELLSRIKPLIIKNMELIDSFYQQIFPELTSLIDQRIFPMYKTAEDMNRDCTVLAKCQSKFLFNKSRGLEWTEHERLSGAFFIGPFPREWVLIEYCKVFTELFPSSSLKHLYYALSLPLVLLSTAFDW